ncbi:pilus assembly protein, partial [Actinomyces sp. MRS3W]|uniref:TadE family protein n=1 Tax=Actinomyces sp. MRS3W TaxID=2800796 RepID=UPI0028FD7513
MPSDRRTRGRARTCGQRGRASSRRGKPHPGERRLPGLGARWQTDDRGAAVVDFALVGVLVIAVSVALLQLTLGLHVRNVLTDAAGEGA